MCRRQCSQCACSLRCSRSPRWTCRFTVTGVLVRPQRVTTPPEDRKPTRAAGNEKGCLECFVGLTREIHSHTRRRNCMNRIHSCFGFFKSESTYVLICVSVYVLMRVWMRRVNTRCCDVLLASGYYLRSDWHSQPLVSDDRSTWRGTARSKRALAHRYTCTQTHKEPQLKSQSPALSQAVTDKEHWQGGQAGRKEESKGKGTGEKEEEGKMCVCVCTAERRQNGREGPREEPTQESDGCAH